MRIGKYNISISANPKPAEGPRKSNNTANIPGGRISKPTLENKIKILENNLQFISPGYISSVIPIIRKLSWINEDVGLAVNDMVQLTNTGHKIKFNQDIPVDKADKMRRHLVEVRKNWGDGVNGIEGLINKMVAQIWISGALCNEWVVNRNLTGIHHPALVNPETIVFTWNKTKFKFEPYQKQNEKTGDILGEKYVKLNTNTFKYFGLNGDTELPYGIPPFMTALNALSTQSSMNKNIGFIMDQVGLLGFFETLLDKPSMKEGESDEQYLARLNSLLNSTKTAVIDGIKDGTVVGFKDDHEFNFQSTSKDLTGVSELYKQNETRIANGLKTSPEFIGIGVNGSQTAISIIFTKMLSQLQNVQALLKSNLEFGYSLELLLAGFDPSGLTVEFKPSTITDELKFQQSQEYKIRNIYNKYIMGIISMATAADEMGYDKPDQNEPRGPLSQTGLDKENREADKDKSDRKTREKNKPVPKRKDNDTKP